MYYFVRQIPFPYYLNFNKDLYKRCTIKIKTNSGEKVKNVHIRMDKYKNLICNMQNIANKYNGNEYQIIVPSEENNRCKIFDRIDVSEDGKNKIIEMFSKYNMTW